jgi:hypothetical protein
MARRVSRHAIAIAVSCGLAACSPDPVVLTIDVTTGHESDAFQKAPAVTRVRIEARGVDGAPIVAAETAPGGSFSLGELDENAFVSLRVDGYDAAGDARVAGQSLGIVVGAIEGGPVPVFAQRLAEWSRAPGELLEGRSGAVATTVGERFLMLAGGDGNTAGGVSYYDMLSWGAASGASLARTPRSLVPSLDGGAVLVVGDDGATWIDFAAGNTSEAGLPSGLDSFARVAGGRVILAPDGSAYLVGATRPGAPSDALLIVAPDRTLRAARLSGERQSAAAAWVEGRGLAVAGGSSSAPGVELLAEDASVATALPYPSDASIGAGAVASGGARIVLIGGEQAAGEAPPRRIDLSCTSDCTAEDLGAPLGVALGQSEAFLLAGDRVLVVGADATSNDEQRCFVLALSNGSVSEVPFREPRRGAALVPAPNGTLAFIGGEHADGSPALRVETFFP